ncbi:hypothetical protein GJ744_001288 [Endocarpon pusillum]|uniref:Uncharacterized protein n=1 Tax=Endocarpon pusillum TaxID=364733 RepID=A0A8H7ACQ1_9EURO|nr:hypothetical protein GJ744_001288 [Endocarpon pusillum]
MSSLFVESQRNMRAVVTLDTIPEIGLESPSDFSLSASPDIVDSQSDSEEQSVSQHRCTQQYICGCLNIAARSIKDERSRVPLKRARSDDSINRENKMTRRLEEIVYAQEGSSRPDHSLLQEQETKSDEDIIKLQILTISALEKDKVEQRKRNMSVLYAMKSQGKEVKEYGEFIVRMVEEEIDQYYLTAEKDVP